MRLYSKISACAYNHGALIWKVIGYVSSGRAVSFIHVGELSKYYFARSFVAREIKYLEFTTVYKATLYSQFMFIFYASCGHLV